MAFRFSLKITVICLVLACCFGRLSVWQWQRYGQKLTLIDRLDKNLQQDPVPIAALDVKNNEWAPLIHRRVQVAGTYDFEHEVVLRNRRYNGIAGTHVLTPLKVDGLDSHILVNRGFIPLKDSARSERSKFRKGEQDRFVGLIKESMYRKIFSPQDPDAGQGHPWVDEWLRVDLAAIALQMPYPMLPIYLEMVTTSDARQALEEVMASEKDGRNEMFSMTDRAMTENFGMDAPALNYPIPMFNKITPPGRHLGYVYEWATMALAVLLMGTILQFRRPTGARTAGLP